jgi:hypothetical protein
MVTVKETAMAWLMEHTPRQWKELLAKFDDVPVIQEEEQRWLYGMVPAFRERAAEESFLRSMKGIKAWARFEEAFIAEVSDAVDRLEG